MTSKFIVLLFTSFIYVLVLIGFNKARKRFAGGNIGKMINLVLVTVLLLFAADYILLFEGALSGQTIFFTQTLFRTAGLSVLAFGGIRISGS